MHLAEPCNLSGTTAAPFTSLHAAWQPTCQRAWRTPIRAPRPPCRCPGRRCSSRQGTNKCRQSLPWFGDRHGNAAKLWLPLLYSGERPGQTPSTCGAAAIPIPLPIIMLITLLLLGVSHGKLPPLLNWQRPDGRSAAGERAGGGRPGRSWLPPRVTPLGPALPAACRGAETGHSLSPRPREAWVHAGGLGSDEAGPHRLGIVLG